MAEIQIQTLVVPDAFTGPRLQAAIDQASALPPQSARAAVWIPATYPGNDTYTNPFNVPVFDMRNGGSISFANGALLPNTPLPFSATPVFNVAQSASYTMTLTGNVTSSFTIGAPKNGNLLSLTLIEDGTGGWTFAFPANFVFPVGYTFDTAANHTNTLTFKFDGTNWNLISNASSVTTPPANPNNILQKNNGGVFGASSVSDDGTTVTIGNQATFNSSASVTGALNANSTATVTGVLTANNDSHFKGPNPYMDVTNFGARAVTSVPSTTGSINATSTSLSLAAASTFVNGDGIVVRGAGPTITISAPSAPTVSPSNAQVMTGTGLVVANTLGAATYQYQVVAQDIGGGYTAASSATSISNGPTALGSVTVAISTWTQSNNTVTVNTSTNHNLVVGTMVTITGAGSNANGWWQVATTPTNTSFTFTTTADTRLSANTAGSGGSVIAYFCNHITWTPVANAFRYLIYGRTSGSMALIGVTLPQASTFGITLTNDPLTAAFDDFGSTMTANISSSNVPDYIPLTPPVSAKNDDLVTTIVSGAGTTTLTLAAAAANTVAGVTVKFDNTPNIITAALASTNNKTSAVGVIYFPAAPGNFVTNSVMNLGQFPRSLAVMQAGSISLGDTLILQKTQWAGQPELPTNGSNFTAQSFPTIQSSTAIPMLYAPNSQISMKNLQLTHNSPSGIIMVEDQGGGIPMGPFRQVQFATSGNDYMAMHLVFRGDSTGGGNMTFDGCKFIAGLSNVVGLSATPLVYFDGLASGPYRFVDTFLNRRGMFYRSTTLGIGAYYDLLYEQGGIMPMISTYTTGGTFFLGVEVKTAILDTMSAPLFTWFGSPLGSIRIPGVIPGLSQPAYNGPVSGSGNGAVSITVTNAGNANLAVTTGSEVGPIIASVVEGVQSGSTTTNFLKIHNEGLLLGNTYQAAVLPQEQAAPGVVVQAGGVISLGAHTFVVAPVFATKGEGWLTAGTTVTTTSGNQTVQITWTAVPGAVGYDIYDNGFSIQCNSPLVPGGNTTSFTWLGNNPARCGVGIPNTPGSGPTGMTAAGLFGPQLTLAGNMQMNESGTFSANRTQLRSDASGTVLLDNGVTAVSRYDNFNRANGSAGSNWLGVNGTGTFTITGNQAATSNVATQIYFWNANTFSADQFSEARMANVTATVEGVAVRASQTNNEYACRETTTTLDMGKIVAGGGFVSLGSVGITGVNGDILRLEVQGTTLNCYRNGVLAIGPVTDSSLTTGQPGIWSGGTSAVVDNWSGGSLHPVTMTDVEQDWIQPQHFLQPITVGTDNAPVSGSLASGTAYLQNVILGATGSLSNPLSSVSGNSGRLAQSTGTLTSGNLASFDANGNVNDSGVAAALLVRTQPGAVNQTGQTASIATATLCAASPGACNVAGQYHVSWNIFGSGTACSNVTAGSVSFNLTWTDENGTAHSAVVMPMTVQTGATTTNVQSTMPFQTALANEGGSGDITISSNGAAAIQYSTTYVSCTTGTGTYNLRATITRLQ